MVWFSFLLLSFLKKVTYLPKFSILAVKEMHGGLH